MRWALWLDGYDFDIIYKAGKENYLADLMTREGSKKSEEMMIKKFEFGESSSSSKISCVELCPQCHYSSCTYFLLFKIKRLPTEIQNVIIEKWFYTIDGKMGYIIPLVNVNNVHIYLGSVMHPYRRIVYIFYPALNWSNYYCIIQTA